MFDFGDRLGYSSFYYLEPTRIPSIIGKLLLLIAKFRLDSVGSSRLLPWF